MIKRHRGFTLIELLVVVSIIGVLSSTVLVALNGARAKARNINRVQNLVTLRTALEIYYTTYNYYPNTCSGTVDSCTGVPTGGYLGFKGLCGPYSNGNSYSNTGSSGYIPNLAPNFIPVLPVESYLSGAGNDYCYLYISNGTDYKVIAHKLVENGPVPATDRFYDPQAAAYPATRGISYAIYTSGASAW